MAAINYVMAAAALNYTDGFSSELTLDDQTVYENLQWVGTPIPKATLESTFLDLTKQQKVAELSAAMQVEVTSGFLSDALVIGTFRRYDSDLQGQIAVIGAVTLCTPVPGVSVPASYTLSSVDPSTGVRTYAAHTLDQLYNLLGDIGTFSSVLIEKLTQKITMVMTTNTGNAQADVDTVSAITWN